ncbi:MAG TPA: CHAD domain-containing protein [Thermoanaerobaculales bacterium]|nr:CHAD domain-containing protein [Thermoanaerobaculales bacterium]
MQATLRLPKEWDVHSLRGALGAGFDADRPRTVRVVFLDTFDWRLASSGGRLTDETADGERALRWVGGSGEPPHLLPVAGAVRFARDIPESVLRSRIESLIEMRALLPVGECSVHRRTGRLRSSAGETAALLNLETASVLDGAGRPVGEVVSRVEVLAIPGFEATFEDVICRLGALTGCDVEALDLMELAVAARGRRIGDYSSKLRLQLDPGQSADSALRSILRTLLGTILANVDGVIADLDTEFLHDLRVATRRTRAALAQVKGVLPAEAVDHFLLEFRWLGSLTNPCRDLDVHLLEMDSFRGLIGDSAGSLAPLQRVIEKERRDAFREVRAGLRSTRFRRLLDSWQSFLDNPTAGGEPPPNADRPVSELASQRISKAFRRMRRHGMELGEDAPLEALHRLRIHGKKLRYLLELFRSLYEEAEVEPLVEELKVLQDILGGINDVRVQQRRLLELAHRPALAGRVETLLAMGRLSGALQQRQDGLRSELAAAFSAFAGTDSRSRYGSLFGSGE